MRNLSLTRLRTLQFVWTRADISKASSVACLPERAVFPSLLYSPVGSE